MSGRKLDTNEPQHHRSQKRLCVSVLPLPTMPFFSSPSLISRSRRVQQLETERARVRLSSASRRGVAVASQHAQRTRSQRGEQRAVACSVLRCSARALYTRVHRGEAVGMLPLHQIHPIPGRAHVSGRVRLCWRHQSTRERDLLRKKTKLKKHQE